MGSPSQKVVIPKGLVNPNETTIVEIPIRLKHLDMVIARPKQDWSYGTNRPFFEDSGPSPTESSGQKVVTKRSYMRQSFPPLKRDVNLTREGYKTFGGRSYEDPADESSHGFHPYVPKSPQTPDVYDYNTFRSHCIPSSTVQDISPVKTPVRPKPQKKPGFMDRMQEMLKKRQQVCLPAAAQPPASPEIYKTSITTSSPEEISTTEITEERYSTPPRRRSRKPPIASLSLPGPGSGGSPFDNFNPHDAATFYHEGGMFHPDHPANRTPPSLYDQSPVSSMYTPGSAEDSSSIPVCSGSSSCPGNSSSGAYQRFDSSGLSPGSPDRSLTQSDVMNSLGQLESSELHKIMGDLSDFQSARRKLVFDASSLASAADVSSNILSHTI